MFLKRIKLNFLRFLACRYFILLETFFSSFITVVVIAICVNHTHFMFIINAYWSAYWAMCLIGLFYSPKWFLLNFQIIECCDAIKTFYKSKLYYWAFLYHFKINTLFIDDWLNPYLIKLNKTRRVLLKHFIRQRFDRRSGHFQAKK